MNDDQPEIITQGSVDTYGDVAQRQRFNAFLALALGVLGALGGGVVGTAAQWLVYASDSSSYPNDLFTIVMGGVPVLIGAAALVLGLQAAALRDPLNAPIGKVGAVLGAVAVVGGVLYAIALLHQ
ncbi:hypothetical protein [Nocardioides sp. InS609-2]|uniref:hypothetical protein n=1 Tax=Nocardioides sp. InS609-2 TaxID=2760705 RepID=UPI0020BE0B30|nr:hypothetical protein [Nocardioides sp. InS609-2]